MDDQKGSINSSSGNQKAKFCTISFQNANCNALVDTGAETTLISENVFEKLHKKQIRSITEPKVVLSGVTGHELKITKSAQICFKFGKLKLCHQFHVVKCFKYDVLLGMDFLESNKAKIDFEHKTLAIGKHVFVLKENIAEKSPQNVMLAKTKHKRILEPRSVCFVKLGVKSKIKGNCLVTPLQTSSVLWDQPGLISPRVLVKGGKNAIVTIMNETNARIVVGKGVPLATIESIENSEISSTMPIHNETMLKGTVNSVQNDSNVLTPKLNENDFHVDTKDKSKPLELSGEMKGKFKIKSRRMTITTISTLKLHVFNKTTRYWLK